MSSSAAVGSDQTQDRARFGAQVDLLEHELLTIGIVELLDVDDCRHEGIIGQMQAGCTSQEGGRGSVVVGRKLLTTGDSRPLTHNQRPIETKPPGDGAPGGSRMTDSALARIIPASPRATGLRVV